MAKRAWLACPLCGGPYVYLVDAEHLPVDGDPIRSCDFCDAGGTVLKEGSTQGSCMTCGGKPLAPVFLQENVRVGEV